MTLIARPTSRRVLAVALLPLALATAGCPRPAATPPAPGRAPMAGTVVARPALSHAVVPMPRQLAPVPRDSFRIDTVTPVVLDAGAPADVERVATYLNRLLNGADAPALRRLAPADSTPAGAIRLRLGGTMPEEEGYALDVSGTQATITASRAAGLFHGVQTLRQLAPWSIEHEARFPKRDIYVPAVRISDAPRFAWRGAMLDVARHFLPARDVERYIDAMALYKLNRLHLHLSDDQGWRIEIASWPNLARHGGSSDVGGGPGGFYTQAEFRDLATYAAERFITLVPEIDMPGHTNAALSAYANLNCDGVAPPTYTGIKVGFSAICVTKDSTYRFIDDVVREISALTPSPWFHFGGDEVTKLTHDQYLRFVERTEAIVQKHGRQAIGWGEIAPARLAPSTIVQHWRGDSSAMHVARGGRVILSPGKKAYLDMKHDTAGVIGLRWAGIVDLRTAYDWDPGTYIPGVPESAVLGVEAPLWSETLLKREDFEMMAFPRLLAVAELGWSPGAGRTWEDFRARVAAHGPRLSAMGVNFYRSPQVDWR